MYILSGGKWRDQYLDYHLASGSLRIEVAAWLNLAEAKGIYFERKFSLRMLGEYIREIGWRAVYLKIRSRLAESGRNQKFYSIGIGRLLESRDCKGFNAGDYLIFIAPMHPKAAERVVLPAQLVRRTDETLYLQYAHIDGVQHYAMSGTDSELVLPELLGWHQESGFAPDTTRLASCLEKATVFWRQLKLSSSLLRCSPRSEIRENSKGIEPVAKGNISAAIYGLGNYAKTQIMPNLDARLQISEIHEIDPTQIGNPGNYKARVTTSSEFSAQGGCRVVFAAGYHHTHADIAARAIESGSIAVVEKPVVTTPAQLERLLKLDSLQPGRLFSCYHMRHNPLFAEARNDLGVNPGEAVHITSDVYEVALPPHHWYNWPSARSHLVSNGCHWLDHFLFMNDYAKPVKFTASKAVNGDSLAQVELANGACLFLHLTHLGSPRVGVQDHVVMRAGSRTVSVTNGAVYKFEDEMCLRRSFTGNRMNAYRQMYRNISAAIVAGQPGDSHEALRYTNELILALDAMIS
ncbi:MAG: Gfo/Idh/MocA family oxidoreductase [Candidatus Riflebacteria bacterium]|nr:Gfo/Idh/MocA family oxidoreductase [Candidatus Riflebacteria bacterium]